MNNEQEREAFEAWLLDEQKLEATWTERRNCYAEFPAHLAYKAWQAGRAALQGQPTDETEFLVSIEDEVQAQAFGPRDQAWAEIQRYAAQYAEDGPIEIWEVTRRRIEKE